MTGRRASTVYEITSKGRRRLREWVETPTFDPPTVEMEAMIRLFFADAGSADAMAATLAAMREQAVVAVTELAAMAEQFATGNDEFPERRATNALTMELFVRLHETIMDWTEWADEEVETWPPIERQRRSVGLGPAERGIELFTAISERKLDSDL